MPSEKLNEIYERLPDVTVHLGHFKCAPGVYLPFARIIFPVDALPRPWPKYLVCRRVEDVETGLVTFNIFDPQNYLMPLLIQEWSDTCGVFLNEVHRTGVFLFEVVTPKKLYRVSVQEDHVIGTSETNITREEFEAVNKLPDSNELLVDTVPTGS